MPKYIAAVQHDPSFQEVQVTALDAVEACTKAMEAVGPDAENVCVVELHIVPSFDAPFYRGAPVGVPRQFRCS